MKLIVLLLMLFSATVFAQTNFYPCMTVNPINGNLSTWWTPRVYTNITFDYTLGGGVWIPVLASSIEFEKFRVFIVCNPGAPAVCRITEKP